MTSDGKSWKMDLWDRVRDHGGLGSCGDGGGLCGCLGPLDWRAERRSGLWNLAFLARGAEIMVLSSGSEPTFYSPHTHPTPAHSEGIWLFSQSPEKKCLMWRRGVMDPEKVWIRDRVCHSKARLASKSQQLLLKTPFPDFTTNKKNITVHSWGSKQPEKEKSQRLCL